MQILIGEGLVLEQQFVTGRLKPRVEIALKQHLLKKRKEVISRGTFSLLPTASFLSLQQLKE